MGFFGCVGKFRGVGKFGCMGKFGRVGKLGRLGFEYKRKWRAMIVREKTAR